MGLLGLGQRWRKPVVQLSFAFIVIVLPSLIAYQNCSPGFNPTSSINLASESAAQFNMATKVLNNRCVYCHSEGKEAAFAPLNLKTNEDFVGAGLIVPGDPDSSKLIYRLKNYHAGTKAARNMPPGSELNSYEYGLLWTWVERMSNATGPFRCEDGQNTLVNNDAQRLSSTQYYWTLRDLLSRFLLPTEAVSIINTVSATYWPPLDATGFKRWDNSFTGEHAKAYFEIADYVASQATADNTRVTNFFTTFVNYDPGSCATVDLANIDCRKQFIRNLGLRVYRRPVRETSGDDEVALHLTEFTGVSVQAAINNIFFKMLLAPHFLFKLEVDENHHTATDVLQLSSYAVANRLSYTFWNSMPDEALLAMAKANDLSQPEPFSRALEHIFANQPRIDSVVGEYMNDWLRLESTPELISTAENALLAKGVNLSSQLRTEMIEEVKELGSYVYKYGSFSDLFTTDVSFARSADLMKIYGVTAAAAANVTPTNAARMPQGTRAGLITRAALLLDEHSTGKQNPVTRAVKIRREIMCLEMSSPPQDLEEALEPPTIDPSMTIREQYAAKTSPTTCFNCHRVLNPVGFALSNFNGFGHYQTFEPAFNADGSFANRELPVNASVDLSEIIAPGFVSNNPVEFSRLVANRPETQKCFTEAFARHSFGREPAAEDGCRLNRVYRAAKEGTPMKDLWRSLALDPEFRLRKLKVSP